MSLIEVEFWSFQALWVSLFLPTSLWESQGAVIFIHRCNVWFSGVFYLWNKAWLKGLQPFCMPEMLFLLTDAWECVWRAWSIHWVDNFQALLLIVLIHWLTMVWGTFSWISKDLPWTSLLRYFLILVVLMYEKKHQNCLFFEHFLIFHRKWWKSEQTASMNVLSAGPLWNGGRSALGDLQGLTKP